MRAPPTVTDAAGRAVPVPAQVDARVSRRSAGRDPALHAGARPAARLAARQPARGMRVPAAGHRRAAGGRPHHRPRQHRQSRSGAGAQARPHPRCRLDQRRPSSRSPSACRSRPAFPMRCSTAASTPSPATYRTLGALIGRPRRGRGACALYAEDTLGDHHRPHRRDPARAAAARLLRARPARARDRARRLDQRRDHRAPGARNVAGEHARRARHRVDRAGAAVESRRDRHHRPGFRGERARAIRPGRRSRRCATGRVHLSPKLPFGWVDFPPSVNRLIGLWWLAQDPLSGAVSRRTCARSRAISTRASIT